MFRQTAKLAKPAELGVGLAVDHPVRHAPGHRRTDAKPDQPRTHLRFGRGAARERKPEQQGGNKAFDGAVHWSDRPFRCIHDVAKLNRPRTNSLTRPLRVIPPRSEEHTSELQSLMRLSYSRFC